MIFQEHICHFSFISYLSHAMYFMHRLGLFYLRRKRFINRAILIHLFYTAFRSIYAVLTLLFVYHMQQSYAFILIILFGKENIKLNLTPFILCSIRKHICFIYFSISLIALHMHLFLHCAPLAVIF